MYPIGRINQSHAAQVFCDYLGSLGINADWLPENGMCVIRVMGAQHVPTAEQELRQFLQQADHPRYRQASWSHGTTQSTTRSTTRASSSQSLQWWSSLLARTGPFTVICVALSLLLSLAAWFGENYAVTRVLLFYWPAISEGELHRLIAPIFLHLGFFHLLFNMMWLWDLGGAIEKRLGAMAVVWLITLTGVLSNAVQYLFSGPAFGGMSGVVYALLGYIWIRGQRDQQFGVHVHRNIVIFMLVWLVLCFTGLMGPVGNAAHVSGLLSGMALGFLAAQSR